MKNRINGLLIAVIFINSCALIGCHRGYYRRQADAEAQRLILEKSVDPRWNSSSGTIDVDPQSRMFNPFSQDHPPIPPDDAASHQFMHQVDGKEGYPHWHANGDTSYVESPAWKSYLPTNENGQLVLNLERAYQIALIHSPDLQFQRETLYQSALDVSLERFGFDTQLFSGFNNFLTTQGRLRNGNGRSSTTFQSQLGANGGGINFQRLGITGTNFAVGLANTILFNFAGNNTQSANSLVNFSVIQPLLRGAGRERILESLTQGERTLLANVRQLERFRRGFYLQVAIGRGPGAGPNRGGNFLNTPGGANFNAGGFVGLLQDQQQIRNQETNVRQLEAVLELFREFFLVERVDAVQLKRFETDVYGEQRNLLNLKTNYQTSLDQFKASLGLPPDVDIIIDDPYLDRFELIGDDITNRLVAIGELRRDTGIGLNRVYEFFRGVGEENFWANFQWPADISTRIEDLDQYVDAAEEILSKLVDSDSKQLEKDFDRLESVRDARVEYLETVKKDISSGRISSNVDDGLFESDSLQDASRLRKALSNPELDNKQIIVKSNGTREIPPRSILKRAENLNRELAEVKARIEDFKSVQKTKSRTAETFEGTELDPELYRYILQQFQQRIPGLLSELNNLALEMSLLQAQARSSSIEIENVELESQQAILIAKCMRRDLMNARAGLVDQYRNIEFVADQLEASVDLVFTGDIGNVGDNPFRLRYETGQLSAGFRFDSPLVRLAERNAYRNALITYQQTRRSFYQFEDSVKANLRNILRNVNRLKVVFELDRLRVQTAIESVEINRFELERPVAPGAANSELGAQTAQNLSNAIISLNTAQNAFVGSWVQFEVLRRNLDFDLGTMQVEENGQWINPGNIDRGIATRAANRMGIQLDCQFCQNVEFYEDVSDQSSQQDEDSAEENSLEFETDENNEPIGTPDSNDPSVLETDSRSIPNELNSPNSESPRRDIPGGDGGIEPVTPVEDLGSRLQRSRNPRKLFQPVGTSSNFSWNESSEQNERFQLADSEPTHWESEPEVKAITPVTAQTKAIPPTVVPTTEPDIKSVLSSKPDLRLPFYPEPTIDSSTSAEFSSLALNGTLANRMNSLDQAVSKRVERVSFWSFFGEESTDETKFGDIIASSFPAPVGNSIQQAVAHSQVSKPSTSAKLELTPLGAQQPNAEAFVQRQPTIAIEPPAETAAETAAETESPQPHTPAPSSNIKSQGDWREQQTSLGGVLNRFRSK